MWAALLLLATLLATSGVACWTLGRPGGASRILTTRRWLGRERFSWLNEPHSQPPQPDTPAANAPRTFSRLTPGDSSTPSDALAAGKSSRSSSRPAKLSPLERNKAKAVGGQATLREDRVVRLGDRRPLSVIRAGDEVSGRVISFAPFGMFVDIGTTIDGLVHVKDVSDTYFVRDISKRFVPGQNLTAWVKFVDPDMKKLGLQLFPVKNATEPLYSWADLKVGQCVEGKVAKFSEAGASVSFGGPCLAFLSRQGIVSNHRQRNLRTWELVFLGQELRCYIRALDQATGRVEVTTYDPALWNRVFPKDLHAQDEERRRRNDDAVQRTLATQEYPSDDDSEEEEEEEVDEEQEDDDDLDDEGEELTADEVQNLTGKQLVLDDWAEGAGVSFDLDEHMRISPQEEAQELSPDELFAMLSEGRAFVTMRNLKDWALAQELVDSGQLDVDDLRRYFLEAGARRGRMDEDAFVNFLDLLSTHLREAADDTDADIDADSNGDVDGDPVDLLDANRSERYVTAPTVVMDDCAGDAAEETARKVGWIESAFQMLAAPGSTKVPVEALLQCSVCLELVRSGAVSTDELRAAAMDMAGRDVALTKRAFVDLVLQLLRLPPSAGQAGLLVEERLSSPSGAKEQPEDKGEVAQKVFASLAGKKGYITLKDLLSWDFVQLAVGQQFVSEQQVQDMVEALAVQAPGKRRKGLDLPGFDRFVDELITLCADSDDEGDDLANSERDDEAMND